MQKNVPCDATARKEKREDARLPAHSYRFTVAMTAAAARAIRLSLPLTQARFSSARKRSSLTRSADMGMMDGPPDRPRCDNEVMDGDRARTDYRRTRRRPVVCEVNVDTGIIRMCAAYHQAHAIPYVA